MQTKKSMMPFLPLDFYELSGFCLPRTDGIEASQRVYRRDRHDAGLRFCPRTLTRVYYLFCLEPSVPNSVWRETDVAHDLLVSAWKESECRTMTSMSYCSLHSSVSHFVIKVSIRSIRRVNPNFQLKRNYELACFQRHLWWTFYRVRVMTMCKESWQFGSETCVKQLCQIIDSGLVTLNTGVIKLHSSYNKAKV